MSHVATRGELRRPGTPRGALLRAVVLWLCVAALLIGAITAAWSAVARDVYGAGTFVGSYLDALAEHDAAAALALPGVALSSAELTQAGLPGASSDALLRSEALGALSEIKLVSDITRKVGTHDVTFSYTLAGQPHSTMFTVVSGERTFGLFPSWRFETSPLSVVQLTVQNTTGFRANGFELDTRRIVERGETTFVSTVPLLTFTPGSVDFDVDTGYLTSAVQTATTTETASTVSAAITADATPGFVEEVQSQVDGYLDGCATQQVLQPTGCPFGMLIRDRVDDVPAWSIATYPVVDVQPGEDGWQMPATAGAARLVVEVKSLFDGTVSTLDEEVPFTLSAFITIRDDGSLYIDLR